MIELKGNELEFSFPQVHRGARLRIGFQRTLRIPDDDTDYPLPPGLGSFPLRHVDDFAERVPRLWLQHGGAMLPMYQSEAMWINLSPSHTSDGGAPYPFAVKVAAGKINAVSGEDWTDGLSSRAQDYLVAPEQPWLDGYCVEKGLIRQFVAMPLGAGYSAEEQLTGQAEHGGIQIQVYPMKRGAFERRLTDPLVRRDAHSYFGIDMLACESVSDGAAAMGLAPGGRMRQEIAEDPFDIDDWDLTQTSRCFVHIANSMVWHSVTGQRPPTTPPTAEEYTRAGLPWFDYYDADSKALEGADRLAGLDSVKSLGKKKGDVPLPENTPVTPGNVVQLRKGLGKDQVREGHF